MLQGVPSLRDATKMAGRSRLNRHLQGVPSLRDGTKGRVGVGEIVLPKWTIEFAMGNCV